MIIGCPKEIKNHEYRVGLVPGSVKELVGHGHKVIVETGAGAGINYDDKAYKEAGASIVKTAKDVFSKADMIVKVKEPQAVECAMLREDQILFTYLHLAADKPQAKALMKSKCVAIAYETVTDQEGGLPLLRPMSEIAGRLSVHVGSGLLQKHEGGLGRLISGVPGVYPARVVIIGGGVAGFNAARMAVGLEANVTIMEKSQNRMRFLDDYFKGSARIVHSNKENLENLIPYADLVIGAVLVPGASAPRLVTKKMLKQMKSGAVLVDIAIDQGGCFETSKPTTHRDPTYVVDGILHYCVANMPGAVPLTSALALNTAILPHALALANKGWRRAVAEDTHLKNGLNVVQGKICNKNVAEALQLEYTEYS
ncbi:MAG: alanine dehydrogenase [Micavibrio sp.]|nr:alanine dehydrogenase [Micavibrio sp.]